MPIKLTRHYGFSSLGTTDTHCRTLGFGGTKLEKQWLNVFYASSKLVFYFKKTFMLFMLLYISVIETS